MSACVRTVVSARPSTLHGFADTVKAVVQLALQAENCTYAGVALATAGGRVEVGAVTDPVVEALYMAQIKTGEGQTQAAMASGVTVYIADVVNEDRWAQWQTQVAATEIRSVLDVPMKAGDQVIGLLSLYRCRPDGFTVDDEAIAYILARHAAVAVSTARQEETMARAVDVRKLVGQAMGP